MEGRGVQGELKSLKLNPSACSICLLCAARLAPLETTLFSATSGCTCFHTLSSKEATIKEHFHFHNSCKCIPTAPPYASSYSPITLKELFVRNFFSELFCQVKFHNSLKLDPAKTGGKTHPFIVALHSCPHCPIVQAKLQGDHSDLLPPKYKKERGFDNILQSHRTSVESSENDCSGDDIMDDQDVG